MTIALIAVMGALAAVFVLMALRKPSSTLIRERLETIAPGQVAKPQVRALEEIELSKPFQERVVRPFLASMARVTRRLSPGTSLEKTEQRLAQAGNPRGLNVEGFFGLKGVTAIVVVVVLGLLMYVNAAPGYLPYPPKTPVSAIEWLLVALVVGFFLPDLWVRDELKRRQKRILKALPDTIDIIAISVEAGLGFDAAVQRVAAKTKDDLSLEFERYLLELRVGKAKRVALRNIIWRTGVTDLSQFITAIIQADQLGVSITNVLRIQSEQMRTRRRQRAEELAHKAPIKMLFPMAFCIFPAIFVVILGPVVPNIMNGLGGK
ncbi:MAG TPA: type II secretion system F family protein [Chloroflexota bacterium]|jgi:tight adherence protein C|nr:type II secretion system F family protein [Chloroflexota bacterium]